mgnify:CR=1 FL=1
MSKALKRLKEIENELSSIPKHYASRYVLEIEQQGILLGMKDVFDEIEMLDRTRFPNDTTSLHISRIDFNNLKKQILNLEDSKNKNG